MRKAVVSSILVVCLNGEFWMEIVKHVVDERLNACRAVFDAEPSDKEILAFMLEEWTKLPLIESGTCKPQEMARNPKRRQREAALAARKTRPSIREQAALAEQRESLTRKAAARNKEQREDKRHRHFAQRQQKAKRKRRGR